MSSNINFDPKSFRKALGAFTTGVTIVTTRDVNGKDVGLTANSFNSVSLDPPLILWSIDKKSSNFQAFMNEEHFAVHILSVEQEKLSGQFSRSGIDRFSGIEVDRGPHGIPLLNDCSARFVCKTHERYAGGDHVIIVGEVIEFDSKPVGPLVFHSGNYALALKRRSNQDNVISMVGLDWLGFMLKRAYEQMFTPVRNRYSEVGLTDYHYHVLAFLGMGNNRSVDEVNSLMKFIGIDPRLYKLEDLCQQNFIEVSEAAGAMKLHLTESGRSFLLELMAIGKQSEADAFSGFEYTEQQVVKNLLVELISNTATNLVSDWRKESVWLESNIWGVPAVTLTGG